MKTSSSYIIIGNGIAGITAAEILRAEDPTSSISIVANDPYPVYYRPALKDYLGGRIAEEKLWARPRTFYQEQRIRFVPARVTGIHSAHHTIQLHDGQQLSYNKLLLANGAYARRLNCAGADLSGVYTLRTVADYQEIVRHLNIATNIVIYGGGTLALESAETLNHLGFNVTHLLRNRTIWSEVLDETASDLVLQEERRADIQVRLNEPIQELIGKNGQITAILTANGNTIPCDLLLVAIGIDPIIDFIQSSGILCRRGVVVDEEMRASVPDVFAAGDVIETTDPLSGKTRVLGQWYPAIQQARIAAYNMLKLINVPRTGTFYNATFLHGLDFVSLGLSPLPKQSSPVYQEIVADPEPRNYRKLLLSDGIPIGAIFLGERKKALPLKRAMDHHVNLQSVAKRIFAADFDLDTWLDQQHIPPAIFTVQKDVLDDPAYSLDSDRTTQLTISQQTSPIPVSLLSMLDDKPSLVLLSKQSTPRAVPLPYKTRVSIGRDQENTIVLADTATSRRHAEIFGVPGTGFYINDLGSSNGIYINKERMTKPTRLQHGDRIIIGNTLLYCSLQKDAVAPATQTAALNYQDAPKGTTRLLPEEPAPTAGLMHRNDTQPFNESRIRFEIDMCIGCDRCMTACPIPMSSQVNIADLNQATITEQIAPHVERFTHECIMCGSCVPVCPVDNHRDLLMLSLKQRIGASWDDPVQTQRLQALLPAGWALPQVIERLREHPILRDPELVPNTYLQHLLLSSQLRSLASGEMLVKEGEYERDLYLILEGRIAVSTYDIDDHELPIAILSRGEFLGEYGILTGQPHTTTAHVQTPALVLQIPEQVLQRLMELVPQTKQFFERLSHARSLESILKRMALFQGVSDYDLRSLINQTEISYYDRNESLFAENDKGTNRRPSRETLHILLEGFVKVARLTLAGTGRDKSDERVIAYRQSGDYFAGGLDLLGDGKAVTVTAINRTRVAQVPRQALLDLFQRYPEVNQRFSVRLREYLETTASVQNGLFDNLAPLEAQHGLHSLVSDGVVEGTEVLVIDLDKCIHCNECEWACERRHGHSRMNRKGMVVNNISIATACRQCQDPVCMLCSRAGIARKPNGEVYITESCIGCGICAERCPYGAISIVDIDEEQDTATTAAEHSTWQRFSNFFTGQPNRRSRKNLPMLNGNGHVAAGPLDHSLGDALETMRKKIAIKCDLCVGYKDQACVTACPMGAAVRVRPTEFFGSTEEILLGRTI